MKIINVFLNIATFLLTVNFLRYSKNGTAYIIETYIFCLWYYILSLVYDGIKFSKTIENFFTTLDEAEDLVRQCPIKMFLNQGNVSFEATYQIWRWYLRSSLDCWAKTLKRPMYSWTQRVARCLLSCCFDSTCDTRILYF